MAASRDPGAAGTAIVSRRDAIVGALALAAGSLLASKPQIALAADGNSVLLARINTGTLPTTILRTVDGTLSGTPYSGVEFNAVGYPNAASYGVEGEVYAAAIAGSAGVRGDTEFLGKYGVLAQHGVSGGTALRVEGNASFSRSGKSTVTKGHSTRTVTVASGVGTGSMILVTLQGSGGSGVYLKYAKRMSATTFKVVLNKTATATVTFAWFILG